MDKKNKEKQLAENKINESEEINLNLGQKGKQDEPEKEAEKAKPPEEGKSKGAVFAEEKSDQGPSFGGEEIKLNLGQDEKENRAIKMAKSQAKRRRTVVKPVSQAKKAGIEKSELKPESDKKREKAKRPQDFDKDGEIKLNLGQGKSKPGGKTQVNSRSGKKQKAESLGTGSISASVAIERAKASLAKQKEEKDGAKLHPQKDPTGKAKAGDKKPVSRASKRSKGQEKKRTGDDKKATKLVPRVKEEDLLREAEKTSGKKKAGQRHKQSRKKPAAPAQRRQRKTDDQARQGAKRKTAQEQASEAARAVARAKAGKRRRPAGDASRSRSEVEGRKREGDLRQGRASQAKKKAQGFFKKSLATLSQAKPSRDKKAPARKQVKGRPVGLAPLVSGVILIAFAILVRNGVVLWSEKPLAVLVSQLLAILAWLLIVLSSFSLARRNWYFRLGLIISLLGGGAAGLETISVLRILKAGDISQVWLSFTTAGFTFLSQVCMLAVLACAIRGIYKVAYRTKPSGNMKLKIRFLLVLAFLSLTFAPTCLLLEGGVRIVLGVFIVGLGFVSEIILCAYINAVYKLI